MFKTYDKNHIQNKQNNIRKVLKFSFTNNNKSLINYLGRIYD